MKCMKCEKVILAFTMVPTNGSVAFGNRYPCIAYICPHCSGVISVLPDPVAQQRDILDGVQEAVNNLQKALEKKIAALDR